jgi:hypothetical protein
MPRQLSGEGLIMRSFTRWLAPLALVGGMASAVAFAGDPSSPLAPRALPLGCVGANTALSYDGCSWCTPSQTELCDGLALLRATYVRGPACISVHAGTCVSVLERAVVQASWDPSARGWQFLGVTGQSPAATINFENTSVPLWPGQSVTLYERRDEGPVFFRPTGLGGSREVSGFEPFAD